MIDSVLRKWGELQIRKEFVLELNGRINVNCAQKKGGKIKKVAHILKICYNK